MSTITAIHATDSKFDRFDASFLGRSTDFNASSEAYAQTAHIGFWFNVDGDMDIMCNKYKMVCNLSINNLYDGGSLATLANYIDMMDLSGEELREELMEQGYDGIVIEDEEFGGMSYVVFSPDQIEIVESIEQ